MPATNPLLSRLAGYPAARLKNWRARLEATGRPVFDFGIGDPVEPVPEFIRQALVDGIPRHSGYPSAAASRAAADAIAGYVTRRCGVDLDPAREILVTGGGRDVTFQIPFLVAGGERTGVIVPDPGYPGYVRSAIIAGLDAIPVPLDGDFRLRPWELAPEVLVRSTLLWLNTPHNPTGAALDRDDLARSVEVCRAHDILVVSDECYLDVYDEDPPPSILEVARDGVLALHSLSKRSGMTGYRSGFVAGDAVWIERLRSLRANMAVPPQDFVNSAAAAAWSDDAHTEERRLRFRGRRRRMRRFLLGAGLEVAASDAAFYLWVRAPGGRTGEAWALELLDHGILVAPGAWYAVTDAARDWVRVALCLDGAALDAALEAWASALEDA